MRTGGPESDRTLLYRNEGHWQICRIDGIVRLGPVRGALREKQIGEARDMGEWLRQREQRVRSMVLRKVRSC